MADDDLIGPVDSGPDPAVEVVNTSTGQREVVRLSVAQSNPSTFEVLGGQDVALELGAGLATEAALGAAPVEAVLEERTILPFAEQDRISEDIAAQVAEERYGGVGNMFRAGIEGGLSGATFGLSDLLLNAGDTELELRETRDRLRTNSTAYAAGRLAGTVAPALLSGGTGFAGNIARLSPAGRISALAGRVAGGGLRVFRGAAAGAFEGMADAIGSQVARESLEADPDFSAGALLGAAGQGALIGAATGGLLSGALRGGDALIRRGAEREARALALTEELTEAAAAARRKPVIGKRLLRETRKAREAAGELGGEGVPLGAIMGRRARKDLPEQWKGLLSQIDDDTVGVVRREAGEIVPGAEIGAALPAGASLEDQLAATLAMGREGVPIAGMRGAAAQARRRAPEPLTAFPRGRQVADLLDNQRVRGALGTDHGVVSKQAGKLVREYQDAADAAKAWMTDYGTAIGAGNMSEVTIDQLARKVDDALEEKGAEVLAALDEARAKLDNVTADLRQLAGPELGPDGLPLPAPPRTRSQIARAVREQTRETGARGWVSRATEATETALGVAEVAEDLGMFRGLGLRSLPVVGPVMSWYLKLKTGAKALGLGGDRLVGGRVARAAAAANKARDQITDAVGRAAKGTLRTLARAPATPVTAAATATEIANLLSSHDGEVVGLAAELGEDLPSDVQLALDAQARRAREYLIAHAPRNPLEGTPVAGRWRPGPLELRDWMRRKNAVTDPMAALEIVLGGGGDGLSELEAEAVREVYPAIWAAARDDLLDRADELAANLPEHRRALLSHYFGLPLSLSAVPGYPPPTSQLAPSPDMAGAPPAVTASPLAASADRS